MAAGRAKDARSEDKKRKSSKNNQSSDKKSPSLNTVKCPKDMTLRQWQRALRRQVAAKENFAIRGPYTADDPFIVTSAGSGRKYRVRYYGPDSDSNRCECMDFKTSGLGTCKHIEAISLAGDGKYTRRSYGTPLHTFVYVDYPAGRKIKIHQGRYISAEMQEHIKKLFDENGELIDPKCDPSDFIREAMQLDETFEWEEDALDIVTEQRDKARRVALISEKYADSLFDGLIKTSLHPYQAVGVRFAFIGGRTINADEMGLGKTVQAIATAELLKREGLVNSVIIICPTSLKYQWFSEIRRFTDSTAVVVEGDVLKRNRQLSDEACFYKIVSFHAMSNSVKMGFIPQTDMIIYDELQRLKNKETQMGKQLRKLYSQYVLALSGTPLENKLDELYSVTQLVDQFVLGPYYKFNAETTLKDESGKLIGYRNLHSIAERLRDTLIRRKKADVKLQMPARTDTNLFVPMTKEQLAIHEDYKFQVSVLVDRWRRLKFLSEPDRQRLLMLLSMMRMVCDSTFILDQKSRHDTKIDETMAIVSNLLDSEDGKVVIFSQWERMVRILAGELKGRGIEFCYLHGGVPSVKRKDLIDRFRDDPSCRIFLSTDAGSTGLNLQSASLMINLDLPWNPAVLEQRIARIYRLGQANPVQIINMISRGTIEERMLSTLKFKSELASGILDGGEDAVYVETGKFEKIVEIIDDVMDCPEVEGSVPHDGKPLTNTPDTETEDEANRDSSHDSSEATPNGGHSADEGAQKPSQDQSEDTPNGRHAEGEAATGGTTKRGATKRGASVEHEEIRKTFTSGLAAIGKIADMLRTPETTEALVDALVSEDPETGKASLTIPVPDKTTVANILSAFSALLNR